MLLGFFAHMHCWGRGYQRLHQEWQTSCMIKCLFSKSILEGDEPATHHARGIEGKNRMPLTIPMGGNHGYTPYQLRSVRTMLCQFASNSNDLVAVTSSSGINKCRNIDIHSN